MVTKKSPSKNLLLYQRSRTSSDPKIRNFIKMFPFINTFAFHERFFTHLTFCSFYLFLLYQNIIFLVHGYYSANGSLSSRVIPASTMKLCFCGWLDSIITAHIVTFVNRIKPFERIKFILLNKSLQNTRT